MKWYIAAASDVAPKVDALFFTLLAVTGIVAAAIFVLIVFFCIRYRRSAVVDRSGAPANWLPLELGWTLTPLAIFLGLFAWAAYVYGSFYRDVPGAMPIFVVGKQWMWKIEHADGRREIDEMHLPVGQPVKLVIASEDVIHSFYMPAFRLKQDAVPGRYTTLSFTPTQTGTYDLRCSEYCGTDHARMGGTITVLAPQDFAMWLEKGGTEPDMAARGFAAFRRLGCSGCHDARSSVHAPDLNGIYGRIVHLQDGRSVIADEGYIRDSILLPKRDVVVGFEPVMPSFAGQATEGDILEIIAYLKSTGKARP
ncbi:MAG TPA: cytochrome c oxidase subunit II [Usitatibacter sp.]|jgi:cytochrome c oxidase subunit 2|nr:cytochrome c oxidase subunit II [Usitatibacter sp.]